MKLTEKQLRNIVRESVYRILNESKSCLFESFSSKILEKLSYEHKGIKNIDTNSANSFFTLTTTWRRSICIRTNR